MSQQVQIDYKQIGIQCSSVCEVAETRLKELDKMVETLEKSSSKIINEQAKALVRQISVEKTKLVSQIERVKSKAEEDAKMGVVRTNNHDARYAHMNDTINAANSLKRMTDVLSSTKLVEFKGLLTALLSESINENYKKMMGRGNVSLTINANIQSVLDTITDEALRQFTFIAYMEDNSLFGDALIKAGLKLMNENYESRFEKESKKIREELEASKISADIIEKVMEVPAGNVKDRLSAIREKATAEVVGEKIRQKSLRIIIKAIQERGFIIDKSNIKIKRDTNEVILIAQKASGEKAEFRVFMDGKFIYDFHGYEGQACQKDILPFLKDLEEVYGVHITKSQEIWSNPDKISTMKYQAINTNKNKR